MFTASPTFPCTSERAAALVAPSRLFPLVRLGSKAAHTASRCDPALGRVYRRLAFRKGTASAKVARRLLIRLYIMRYDQPD
jgi:hypothetical protein